MSSIKDTFKDKVVKEFKLTSLALNNKNTILLLAIAILGFGLLSYRNMPKELQPEIVIPTVMVQATYPGNPPVDIENLITRPLEKEIETVDGIKDLSSTSAQGYSMIYVEFNTDVNIDKAMQDVKDAVDNAKRELPNDMLIDPMVMDIDISEFPILNINLSGDFSLDNLNTYAEYLEDKIETVNEISKVNIKGINEKEVQINVDPYKLEAMGLTFNNIEMAITAENISISGGELIFEHTKRSIRTVGEFTSDKEIENIIISNGKGKIVYLKDVAEVKYTYAYPENFARLDNDPVVSVQVVKKSGENILSATDNVFAVLDKAVEEHQLPDDLHITITNDQSDMVRMQLQNLENSMILGVIFVVFVLFYFLGTRNALFVGIAIPMSIFLSFIVLGVMGNTLNMIVMFGLILALGMLVDNAIVVVENIHRFIDKGYKPFDAAKQAVGEVAVPIITSTLTTLSAFIPLAFWGGVTGEFMKLLPITLIIVLTSSLFVALVIIPVFAAAFIGNAKKENKKDIKKTKKRNLKISGLIFAFAVFFYLIKIYSIANLLIVLGLIIFFDAIYFYKFQYWFQKIFLSKLEIVYLKALQFSLRKRNPIKIFIASILLLVTTIILLGLSKPKILFFPDGNPNYINVRAELPVGTDIYTTDSIIKNVEKDINKIIQPYDTIVESVLTTVGNGAGENFTAGDTPNLSLTTISFVDYIDRQDYSTSEIMKKISTELYNKYAGVEITVEKNRKGPPTGDPINIEIRGDDFIKLTSIADAVETQIKKENIKGIEGLEMDLELSKPELIVNINREKARRFGISTVQIASSIRTSLFGKEISDFKVGEDEYPIQLRLAEKYRNNVSTLINQKISFKKEGKLIQLPISAIADITYGTTYGAIKRKELDRVITLSSNVIEGYNANEINQQLKPLLANFDMPEGYKYEFTGEQQDQKESMDFLINALIIAVVLILIILVTQFNSLIKPLIIIASVVFSTIGVLGGIAIFNMDIIVVMTGIGIISLAGIVVNNAIVLIDYIELLKQRKRKELGYNDEEFLPVEIATECIVEAGKTRLRPVLLTAITTILGLLPMAVGLNINFGKMLSEFEPEFYVGGDMVAFWGPIAWTVIFGLTFATILTLVVVPVMYRLSILGQKMFIDLFANKNKVNNEEIA